MFDDVMGSWVSMIAGYFSAPLAVLGGSFTFLTLTPAIGILCLVAGVVLALRWREKRAPWTLVVIGLALFTLPALALAYSFGWFGMAFAILVGAALLLVITGLVANIATRRLPIWLLGLFAMSLAAYSSVPALIVIFGGI